MKKRNIEKQTFSIKPHKSQKLQKRKLPKTTKEEKGAVYSNLKPCREKIDDFSLEIKTFKAYQVCAIGRTSVPGCELIWNFGSRFLKPPGGNWAEPVVN